MHRAMSQPAYRHSSSGLWLWVGICLLGLAAGAALAITLGAHPATKHRHWGLLMLVACLPFFAALAVAVFMDRRMKRLRRLAIAARLASMGYDVTLQPTDKDKEVFFQRVAVFKNALDLRTGPAGVKWAAFRNPPGGGQELVGEYEFTTGSGKSTVEHTRTFALFPDRWPDHGGTPAGWHAAAVIHRLGKLARRLSRKQGNKDPSFSRLERHWAIYGDTSTAQRILTPRFCELLASSPGNEIWCLGGDLLCCGCQAPLNAENLVLFLDRLKAAAG